MIYACQQGDIIFLIILFLEVVMRLHFFVKLLVFDGCIDK